MKICVTGAGGFIGSWLVKRLKAEGHWVRGIDQKKPEFDKSVADNFLQTDLRQWSDGKIFDHMDQVYHLAADMGGIGYISTQHAEITRNNTLIDLHVIESCHRMGVSRILFSSSACVYPRFLQAVPDAAPLKEECAIPADPEFGYGWAKLFTEQLLTYYREDTGLDSRIVRFHNVYGPLGTYDGGREKAIAALCRKIVLAPHGGEIEVWGDGSHRRSFVYIDDVVEGIIRLMKSDYVHPLNLGTEHTISVSGLAMAIAAIAGKKITMKHDMGMPQGVAGRNSDNTRLKEVIGWEPKVNLVDGLTRTYRWIKEQMDGIDHYANEKSA